MGPSEALLSNDPRPSAEAPVKLCIGKVEKEKIEKSEKVTVATVPSVNDAIEKISGQKLPEKKRPAGPAEKEQGHHQWIAHLMR